MFYNVNLSGADFTNAEGLDDLKWKSIWAWDDNEPIGLPIPVEYYSSNCRNPDYPSSNIKPAMDCKIIGSESIEPNAN